MSSVHPKMATVQAKWMEPTVFVAVISIISAFIPKCEIVESRPLSFTGSGELIFRKSREDVHQLQLQRLTSSTSH